MLRRSNEMASKVEEILSMVEEMSVMELAELVDAFEEKFGVSAAAPVAAMPAGGQAGGAEEEEEEQTEFDVVLTDFGDKKIQVIKVVREVTSLGLREAKEVVDNAPNEIKEAITEEEAEEIKGKLEEVGATVEIK
jgi:large subunit ribosomal protein L7/L12